MLNFPTSGGGQPWARIDGRNGMMTVSGPDDQHTFDMKKQVFAFNVKGATQGWLALANGRDWQPIANGQWGNPPSADHQPGVEIEIYSKSEDFGDSPIRVASASSKAFTSFISAVASKAGSDLPDDAWPTIRVDGVTTVKVGKGSSIDISFTMAPRDRWYKPEREAPAAAPAAPKQKPLVEQNDLGDDAEF